MLRAGGPAIAAVVAIVIPLFTKKVESSLRPVYYRYGSKFTSGCTEHYFVFGGGAGIFSRAGAVLIKMPTTSLIAKHPTATAKLGNERFLYRNIAIHTVLTRITGFCPVTDLAGMVG